MSRKSTAIRMTCSSIALFINVFLIAQVTKDGIDTIVMKKVVEGSFEGTILIANDGNIQYQKSFGFVDRVKSKPVEIDNCFSIASITKMITSIIILQLGQEGRLHLSDNLKSHLPELDIPGSDKITIHHLLLHISGLPNESDSIYFSPKSPKEFVEETIANQPLNSFGSFNYANIDYVLLGLIIESIEGTTWQQSVSTRIIYKLHLRNTGFLKKGFYPENYAYSFSFDENQERKSDPDLYIENYYAAGCMYSTAEDLLKIDQALYGDALLSEKSKSLMYTSYPEYNYSGYGVWTYNYPFLATQPKLMERRGGIYGSRSVLVRMLDDNKTLIILSNNDQFNPDSFGDLQGLKEALILEISKDI